MEESDHLKKTVRPLTSWFAANKRDLPWRKDVSAYHVWVSEIMLQQTRVEAVKPYYARFLAELPDVEALADVPDEKLLKLWEGLGYYSRARNMKAAAREIMETYGGQFPESYEQVRALKGIGDYTAGAICSIVYGKPVPAVDGNVLRVTARLLKLPDDISTAAAKKKVRALLEKVMPADAPGEFNQALMELGALICLPKGEPGCGACPLADLCLACREACVQNYPVKSGPMKRRIEKRTVLLVRMGKRTALHRRPQEGLLAGMYEFPNADGWISTAEVLRLAHAHGLKVLRVRALPDARHVFSHVEWQMRGYEVTAEEAAGPAEKTIPSDEAAAQKRQYNEAGEAAARILYEEGIDFLLPQISTGVSTEAERSEEDAAMPQAVQKYGSRDGADLAPQMSAEEGLPREKSTETWIFVNNEELKNEYPVPSAFAAYRKFLEE